VVDLGVKEVNQRAPRDYRTVPLLERTPVSWETPRKEEVKEPVPRDKKKLANSPPDAIVFAILVRARRVTNDDMRPTLLQTVQSG